MQWNESGFRPLLCTYRLNWARRTSWGWWDDWDDTVLQTQDSKFEPWRSEAEHATSRSRRLPTILTFWSIRKSLTGFIEERAELPPGRRRHLTLLENHRVTPGHSWSHLHHKHKYTNIHFYELELVTHNLKLMQIIHIRCQAIIIAK